MGAIDNAGWRKSSYSDNGGNCIEVGHARWRKSTHSDNGGDCIEVGHAGWRKSSRSDNGGECVEVGHTSEAIAVRDTQDRTGPVLTFSAPAWRALVIQIKG